MKDISTGNGVNLTYLTQKQIDTIGAVRIL